MSERQPVTAWPSVPEQTLSLLGGAAACVREPGLPLRFRYQAVRTLGRFYAESDLSIMRRLGVNERTALRRKERGELSPDESDRLARLARVTRVAIEAFGDEAKARRWLTSPNRALQQHMPLDLIASDAGAQAVTDELGRIEYGELY